MKLLKDRIWWGDFETVYEEDKPYFNLFTSLATIAEPTLSIQNINEQWFWEDDHINIKISYESGNNSHLIWTQRKGDYYNMAVLFIINMQLKLCDYKFEYSFKEESVYFINDSEKKKLINEGIIFDQQESSLQFDLILYNVLMNLETEKNDFTYEMITELNQNIEEYHNQNWQKKTFKEVLESIRIKLLPRLNWQRVIDLCIETDKLYSFSNKTDA